MASIVIVVNVLLVDLDPQGSDSNLQLRLWSQHQLKYNPKCPTQKLPSRAFCCGGVAGPWFLVIGGWGGEHLICKRLRRVRALPQEGGCKSNRTVAEFH